MQAITAVADSDVTFSLTLIVKALSPRDFARLRAKVVLPVPGGP